VSTTQVVLVTVPDVSQANVASGEVVVEGGADVSRIPGAPEEGSGGGGGGGGAGEAGGGGGLTTVGGAGTTRHFHSTRDCPCFDSTASVNLYRPGERLLQLAGELQRLNPLERRACRLRAALFPDRSAVRSRTRQRVRRARPWMTQRNVAVRSVVTAGGVAVSLTPTFAGAAGAASSATTNDAAAARTKNLRRTDTGL
jgi:hypothetical protein